MAGPSFGGLISLLYSDALVYFSVVNSPDELNCADTPVQGTEDSAPTVRQQIILQLETNR